MQGNIKTYIKQSLRPQSGWNIQRREFYTGKPFSINMLQNTEIHFESQKTITKFGSQLQPDALKVKSTSNLEFRHFFISHTYILISKYIHLQYSHTTVQGFVSTAAVKQWKYVTNTEEGLLYQHTPYIIYLSGSAIAEDRHSNCLCNSHPM